VKRDMTSFGSDVTSTSTLLDAVPWGSGKMLIVLPVAGYSADDYILITSTEYVGQFGGTQSVKPFVICAAVGIKKGSAVGSTGTIESLYVYQSAKVDLKTTAYDCVLIFGS
jgi:hypothetical protein